MDKDKDIERLTALIEGSKKIVFFGGAGVSTESGIPDFRSEDGIFKAINQYGKSPEEILSHSFFIKNPEIFYEYYKNNMLYKDAKPNGAHIGLGKLEKRGKLLGVITQNIDGLHQLGGSQKVYELHGTVRENYCMDCGSDYSLEYILEPQNCIDQEGKKGEIPYCKECHGIVKPNVVLYEEALDQNTIQGAVDIIKKSDLLIVGGTSLVVYPAASLINYFSGESLVLINKSKTNADKKADLVIHKAIGEVFDKYGKSCGILNELVM